MSRTLGISCRSRFFICTLVFLTTYNLQLTTSLAQDKKKELQEQRKKLEKNIAYQKLLLKKTKETKDISLIQIVILNKKIKSRYEYINLVRREMRLIDQEIIAGNAVIESMESDLENLKREYARCIVNAYRNRNTYDRLLFLFSSEDFYQAYRRLKYIGQYNEYRRRQAELIVKTQAALSEKIAGLERRREQKRALLGEEEQQRTLLESEKKEEAETIGKLQREEKTLRDDIRKKEDEMKKLQKAIDELIAREIAEQNKFRLTPEAQRLSDNFEKNKGRLPWPLIQGQISSGFGKHIHPVLGIETYNNGIDIMTEKGSRARAVFDGEVTGVITVPGSGKAVLVRHGMYLTVYSKLQEVYVKKGDKVLVKQDIGLIMTDGSDGKTELHFELRVAEKTGSSKLNPAVWLFPMD